MTWKWKPRTRKGEGKVASKVTGMLLDELSKKYPGIGIAPTDFWFQKGAYTHMTWDLARWGADIPIPDNSSGMKVMLYSWDTMKQCAESGIELLHNSRNDGPHQFGVCAKSNPI